MADLATLGRQLEEKRAQMQALFQRSESDQRDPETGKPYFKVNGEIVQEIDRREAELADLERQFQAARLADINAKNDQRLKDLARPDYSAFRSAEVVDQAMMSDFRRATQGGKKLSELVLDSIGYKSRQKTSEWTCEIPDVDVKTLMQTSAGWDPPIVRESWWVPSAQPTGRTFIQDFIPSIETGRDTIEYMEETTFTNAAATVSEGGHKPEAALAYTARTSPVRKIATFLPVTDEQLEDVPGLQGIIDQRLSLMVRLREQIQILTGNGAAPNLTGFLNASGLQTQAIGADNRPDAIFNAMTLVRWTGDAEPTLIVLHPNDWTPIRTLKTTTNEYVWGHPSQVGPETLWGKPVLLNSNITEGTGLTGDFQLYSEIYRRKGLRIDVSNSHRDWFQFNQLAIRCETRLALVIKRGAAFCQITGL